MKIYLIIGAALALIVTLGATHRWAYENGRAVERAETIEAIKKENDDAGKAAENARADRRLCSDAGGLWDFETGTCNR